MENRHPSSSERVMLTGDDLTVEQVIAVCRYNCPVQISQGSFAAMKSSRDLVEKILEEGRTVYGISTGFGNFSDRLIDSDMRDKLQENLILSHAVGVGAPLSEEVVRGMLLLRANALCKGFSGIRPEVVETLVQMLNKRVHPVVPEKGSLGASGDLAPLSHMSLVVLGKGEAYYNGLRMSGAEAMKAAGISTHRLQAKEGLALINGTQAMTAVGTLAYWDAYVVARSADVIASMTLEGLNGLESAFDARVHAVRPHRGQQLVAENIRKMTAQSQIIESSRGLRVQDAYTLRCIPQVHGAVRDALEYVRREIEIEINSVTDNPILFAENGDVISGGNFHGEPMALAFDFLGIAVSEIANISERRLERTVNPSLSNGLPAFLTPDGGLNSGYMICQYSAASLVSENKVLAHPASVDSIPSSANQEDHVSMGTIAARKALSIVENTMYVLAFELMAAVQAIEFREHSPSPVSSAVCKLVRNVVSPLECDREFRLDIEQIHRLIEKEEVLRTVLKFLPDFN